MRRGLGGLSGEELEGRRRMIESVMLIE